MFSVSDRCIFFWRGVKLLLGTVYMGRWVFNRLLYYANKGGFHFIWPFGLIEPLIDRFRSGLTSILMPTDFSDLVLIDFC